MTADGFQGVERLLHLLTNKAWRRAQAAGLDRLLTRDDLFQEACVAWLQAKEGFNPDFGSGFPVYLCSAVYRRFNAVFKRLGSDHVFTVSADAETETGWSLIETLPSPQEAHEELAYELALGRLEAKLSRLSAAAKFCVLTALNPPPEILAEFRAFQEKQGLKLSKGIGTKRPQELNPGFVLNHILSVLRPIKRSEKIGVSAEISGVKRELEGLS